MNYEPLMCAQCGDPCTMVHSLTGRWVCPRCWMALRPDKPSDIAAKAKRIAQTGADLLACLDLDPQAAEAFMDAAEAAGACVEPDAPEPKSMYAASLGLEDAERIASQLEVAMAALVAIRDQRCPDDCDEPGPWTDHYHTEKPGIIARNALRTITGKKEKASLWGDGTGGPVRKAPKRLTRATKDPT